MIIEFNIKMEIVESIYTMADKLCWVCIEIMKNVSASTGLTYGFINILLFVVLGPCSTICFAVTTFLSYRNKHKYKIPIIVLSIIGILCILPIFILSWCALWNLKM